MKVTFTYVPLLTRIVLAVGVLTITLSSTLGLFVLISSVVRMIVG